MRYNSEYPYQNNNGNKNSSNTALIVIISVLSAVLIAIIIFGILFATGVLSLGNKNTAAETPAVSEASKEEAPKAEPVQTTVMYIANVENSVYFRSAPIEDGGNIVTTIAYGTAVTFIENADAVFAKISYNGQEGYVKREYLSTSVPPAKPAYPSASSGNTTVISSMYIANVPNSVYFRSEPAENSSNIICEIALGTQVGYIEKTNSVFSKIKYNGKYGYVKTQYLSSSPSYTTGGGTLTVCNVPHSIYLRSAPVENSSNIICEIPVGSSVTFIENANGTFYKIRWNGKTGYAKAEYLR